MNAAFKIQGFDLEIQKPTVNSETSLNFLEEIKRVNKLPFSKGDFYFTDNIWDFAPYKKTNTMSNKLKFDFNKVCDVFRDELKFYVLFKLLENSVKIQTVHTYFNHICDFFNDAYKAHFYSVRDITPQFVEKHMSKFRKFTHGQQSGRKVSLKFFYSYYSVVFTNIWQPEIEILLNDRNHRILKAERANNKTQDIPQEYYNQLLSAILKTIDDESLNASIRSTAAFMLILSQTGLRISECLALEIDCMESIPIFNGEIAYYLKYKTWKNSKGDSFSWNRIYVNELTKKGYDFLVDIYKDKRELIKTNYLYLGTGGSKKYPIPVNTFIRAKCFLFIAMDKYLPSINLAPNTYENIGEVKLVPSPEEFSYIQGITMPSNHQFRVHVCSELYKKGVPLKYIEKFMSHLSSEMADYYVRPTKQNPQENMEFSLDTLQKIVTGETKLLGGNGGLQTKINEFIEKNNYNVETDLQAICEKLAENIPIRQKTGGVCIKSSQLRECSKDSKTNEFYCAYGVCPNIFHFYYMADVSYRQAKELAETIEINKGRGLLRQVEKESNMLHNVVKNKLIPELDELKNVINKKGVQAVMMEYPDLKEIIENLDDIYKEAEQWISMK